MGLGLGLVGIGLNWANFVGNMVTWAPHVKPTWADCMSPIRDVSGLSKHGHKQDKLYGPNIVSETWAPYV